MSLYYEIALECGTQEADTTPCEAYLGTLAAKIPEAFVSRKRYPDGETWVNICIPWKAIGETEWAVFLRSAWQMPLFALPFRFGIAGFDVDLVRTYQEMLEETEWDIFDHVALSDALWQAVGQPAGFHPQGRHHVQGMA
jgi:hypothetical protein